MIRSLFIAPKDPCDVLASEVELALLRREFPTVAVEAKSFPPGGASTIDVDEWRDPAADLGAFDRLLDLGRAPRAIGIVASSGPIAEAAMQILTRYQGVLDRRNEASQGRLFDKVLERRLELEPDRAAALDVWQWTLRLAPRADLALQLAA
ncbi:MAG: hypothetical protein H5U40_02600, partial [Polyangiaceae bacterium]|nr:hypothetical protein [Polyangiaceae bacterium]